MTTDKEKIPYIECLYRTGKTVYKWWFITLAVIGVIAGLGFVISSVWSQIVDGFNYITKSVFGIYSLIGGCIGYVLSILGTIPWYWWIGIGVVMGPLLIVAVYCALKRRKNNSDIFWVADAIIFIISIWGVSNGLTHLLDLYCVLFGIFSAFCIFVNAMYFMILLGPTTCHERYH